ncbi:hypothetical protein CDAR_180461 [Caerostris darwini]|uniref:Uncharacterized protein n=1 Tax=Caerostris darwini TaxID=1538125 RepID=A0AAV4NP34_9ARAC|nr:hypothetical protein CDAR_180461 [Caerostris darwini]
MSLISTAGVHIKHSQQFGRKLSLSSKLLWMPNPRMMTSKTMIIMRIFPTPWQGVRSCPEMITTPSRVPFSSQRRSHLLEHPTLHSERKISGCSGVLLKMRRTSWENASVVKYVGLFQRIIGWIERELERNELNI